MRRAHMSATGRPSRMHVSRCIVGYPNHIGAIRVHHVNIIIAIHIGVVGEL